METEKKTEFRYQNSKFFVVSDDESQDEKSPEKHNSKLHAIRMTGYKFSLFGFIAKISIIVMSFIWLIILTILIADYYGFFAALNYKERTKLFVDQPTLSNVFVIVWHIVTIWFLVLQLNAPNLKSYFLTKESFINSTHVLVEKKIESQESVNNLGNVAEYFLAYFNYLKSEK